MKIEITRTGRCAEIDNCPCLNSFWEKGRWFIKIKSLKELFDLSNSLNEELVIIGKQGQREIEIYDDYRE